MRAFENVGEIDLKSPSICRRKTAEETEANS